MQSGGGLGIASRLRRLRFAPPLKYDTRPNSRNLKAEIDSDRIEAYRGTVSLPFEPGEHKRIAVKIVDDRGIESLKVLEVE